MKNSQDLQAKPYRFARFEPAFENRPATAVGFAKTKNLVLLGCVEGVILSWARSI